MDLIVVPPSWTPSSAKGVLQDCANATTTCVEPDPVPHCSFASLLRKLPFGSLSGCGEAIRFCGFRVVSWVYQAELVTILKVEPGGRVVCEALLISGLGSSPASLLKFVFSVLVFCTA